MSHAACWSNGCDHDRAGRVSVLRVASGYGFLEKISDHYKGQFLESHGLEDSRANPLLAFVLLNSSALSTPKLCSFLCAGPQGSQILGLEVNNIVASP